MIELIKVLILLLFIKFVRPKWTLKLSKWFLKKRLQYSSSLVDYFTKSKDRLSKKQNPFWETRKDLYEDMTPYSVDKDDHCDNIALEALQWAVLNENVKNIAITGPYGSGKSTVLNHFEKRNPNYKYLNISLATFRDEPFFLEDENESKNISPKPELSKPGIKWTEYLQQIEFSILQQLAYKEKWKRSKSSGFKKINHLSLGKRFWYTSLILTGVISFLLAFFPSVFSEIFPESKDGKTEFLDMKSISVVALVFFFFISFWVLYRVLGIFSNSKIQKLKLKDGEIELGENYSNSLLNNFLSEIIYYFETSGCDIVFFEDLDRFKYSDTIFEKLREINLLLNQAKQLRGKRIVFVYAIKDEVFGEKNRTKFFDFIIPVIPFIDSKNSEVFLMERLPEIERKLISDISFYIDDMRLLKNICNEYKIFEKRLKSMYEDLTSDFQEVFDNEQVLALVTFKNISPNKFSQLYLRPENNLLFNQFFLNRNSYNILACNVTKERINEIEQIIENGIEPESDNDELPDLENLLLRIPEMELKTLLEEFEIQLLLDNEDILISKLINLLIRNGSIKENYESYISLFHSKDGYLSQNDKIFIDSVKQRKLLDFKAHIDNPKTVIEKLKYDLNLFKHPSSINYHLVEFMMSMGSEYFHQLNNLFGQFANETERSIELFEYYNENGQKSNQRRFFRGLIRLWPNAWLFIVNDSNYSIQQKDSLLIKFIRFGILKDLEVMKVELSKYINNHQNFIDLIDDSTIVNSKVLLKKFGLKLNHISNSIIDSDLFEFILENNHYQINEESLRFLVTNLGNEELKDLENIKVPNYTAILKSGVDSLIDYIEENLEVYLSMVLLKTKDGDKEEEESIIRLLNNEDLSDELKEKIVEDVPFELEDINEIENAEFWHHLFKNNKVEPNWLNVYYYYSEKDSSIDEYLIEYLDTEKNYLILSEMKFSEEILIKEELLKITKSLLLCNDLNDDSYSNLQKSLIYYYNNFELMELSTNKVQILIDSNRLNLTQLHYSKIKEHFGLQVKFLESKGPNIIRKFDELNLDSDDILAILNSEKITFSVKESLLPKIQLNFYSTEKRTKVAAQLIYKSEKVLDLSIDVICEVIEHTTNEIERIILFNRYSGEYEESQISDMLNAIGGKFEKMNEPSAFGWEIPNTDENLQLVEFLVGIDFLSPNSKPKRNGKKIKIYK